MLCAFSAASARESCCENSDCCTAARTDRAPTWRSVRDWCWCNCVSRTSYTSISARPGRGAHCRSRSSSWTVSVSCCSRTVLSVASTTSVSSVCLCSSRARRCVRRTPTSWCTGISSTSRRGSLPHAEKGLRGENMWSATKGASLSSSSSSSPSFFSSVSVAPAPGGGASGAASSSPISSFRISSATRAASTSSGVLMGIAMMPTPSFACSGNVRSWMKMQRLEVRVTKSISSPVVASSSSYTTGTGSRSCSSGTIAATSGASSDGTGGGGSSFTRFSRWRIAKSMSESSVRIPASKARV
mmetsp:Transcript_64625/g.154229  ORF Transcript_64625/g.154229 Transcript_64625/m.154229 type:complete len:300 (+) Transcript_64625:871-1770(+)